MKGRRSSRASKSEGASALTIASSSSLTRICGREKKSAEQTGGKQELGRRRTQSKQEVGRERAERQESKQDVGRRERSGGSEQEETAVGGVAKEGRAVAGRGGSDKQHGGPAVGWASGKSRSRPKQRQQWQALAAAACCT
jgi:hypothetical protein